MVIRTANATWKGNLKEGKGIVSTESGLIKDADYSFSKRFENEKGTNPEELLGAAHAACFSMALSANLEKAGHNPKSVSTLDKVFLEKGDAGFSITKIEINCEAEVPGIDEKTFLKIAEETKKGCPVARAITGVEYVLKAKLK
jgi:osmotically inducible protein OsmC